MAGSDFPDVMETLKRTSKRWWPAVFAASRYVAYNALLAYHTWHIAVKDIWPQLTSWDKINVGCSVGLSILVAIGAVMNDKWSKARQPEEK